METPPASTDSSESEDERLDAPLPPALPAVSGWLAEFCVRRGVCAEGAELLDHLGVEGEEDLQEVEEEDLLELGWSHARTQELWSLISSPSPPPPPSHTATTPNDAPHTDDTPHTEHMQHDTSPASPPSPPSTPSTHRTSISSLGPLDPWPPWLSDCGLGDVEATLLGLGVESAEDLLIVEAADLEEEGMTPEEAQSVWTRIQGVIAALLEDDDE